MRRALLAMLVASPVACGELRSRLAQGPDGGVPIGDSGPADNDSGLPDGGLPDGGSPDSGGGGFHWSQLTPLSADQFNAIWGIGSGASVVLYAAHSPSRVDRFAAGVWQTVFTDPGNADALGIWVSPDEQVFGGGMGRLFSCVSNCAAPASYTWVAAAGTATAVCGTDAQHVYAVGVDNTNTGWLQRWRADAGIWDLVSSDTSSTYNAGCWVAPDGAVFIAAQSAVLRFDGVALNAEPIVWPVSWTSNEIAGQFFTAIGGSGTSVFAVGTHRRVISRDLAGRWQLAFNPSSAGAADFNAVAVGEPAGALAAGYGSPSAEVSAWLDSSAWAFDPAAPPITALGAWAAGPDEYYLAGLAYGSLTGMIYRASR